MNFPLTGVLLIALSVYFFLFAPRALYLATVFLIPFSAMAVVNVGWGGGEKGIAAWIFMGTLWMVRTSISERPFWRHPGWWLTRRARIELLVLLACGFVSLLVPLMLDGTAWVQYYRLNSNEMIPLTLNGERITQTGYFAFGVVFIIFVAVENCDPRRLLQSVRAYVASAIFVSLWGFVQLWCILTGHAYPAFLFNNSMGTSAQLYIEQFPELDLHRVSSVAVEPSQFAFSMLLAFIILLVAIGLRRPILSRRWDVAALLLVTAALLISTATTAYAGLVIASCLAVVVLARAGAIRWLYVFLAVGVAALGVAIALTVPVISDLVDLVILNKAQSYSATERLHSFVLAVHYFLEFPIFGLSWNTAGSGDLVMEFLASLGIVGFSAFAIFLRDELLSLWRAPARGSRWAVILLAGVCLMLALSETTGFPFAMGYVWFTLGLGISAPFVVSRQPLAGGAVRAAVGTAPVRDVGGLRGHGQLDPSSAGA
ncbi:MAG TPA: hypothetical protein VNM47_02120 [Terriglobia bacterium]|nr:hypothetical protein [Terriglobia bacterium]